MHMADALISPAVGGAMWAVSAGLLAYGARRTRDLMRANLAPMMGVLGAFVFTAQMINFTIPGTGSSGHLGGGLLLAILLGPPAALLVMASVLSVQAFFFADGGLLALGCNILNLGFFPAFVAYPLIYRPLAHASMRGTRSALAAIAAAVAGLQLGAGFVVLQTWLSGLSALPPGLFLSFMLPIHLFIGLVEGLATAGVVSFVARVRPEVLPSAGPAPDPAALRRAGLGFLLMACIMGGVLSWLASTRPDGLEWSILKASDPTQPAAASSAVHERLAQTQERVALWPDYAFRDSGAQAGGSAAGPAMNTGASASGLVGGLATLLLVSLIGLALRRAPRGGTGPTQ